MGLLLRAWFVTLVRADLDHVTLISYYVAVAMLRKGMLRIPLLLCVAPCVLPSLTMFAILLTPFVNDFLCSALSRMVWASLVLVVPDVQLCSHCVACVRPIMSRLQCLIAPYFNSGRVVTS